MSLIRDRVLPLLAVAMVVSASCKRVRPDLACTADDECSGVESAVCSGSGFCECGGDKFYYVSSPIGCLTWEERLQIESAHEKFLLVELACQSDSDCAHIVDSTCTENLCQCQAPRQYFLRPEPGCYTTEERNGLILKAPIMKTRDFPVDPDHVVTSPHPPHTLCTNADQCTAQFENAICVEGACKCNEGDSFHGYGHMIGCFGVSVPEEYKNVQRTVRRADDLHPPPTTSLDGPSCSSDEVCTQENSYCHPNNICACKLGFYRNGGICDKITIGTPCPVDGSDDNFCRRGVVRGECCPEQHVCKCPESHPVHLNDDRQETVCVTEKQKAKIERFQAMDPGSSKILERQGRPER